MAIVSGFIIIIGLLLIAGLVLQIFLSITKSCIPGLVLPIIFFILGLAMFLIFDTAMYAYGFLPNMESAQVPMLAIFIMFTPSGTLFLIYGICRLFVGGRQKREEGVEPWRRD